MAQIQPQFIIGIIHARTNKHLAVQHKEIHLAALIVVFSIENRKIYKLISYYSNDECQFTDGLGAGFFVFDISKNTLLTSPPTLTLENVQFRDFVYEFNSFIELNDYGGHITMTNTKFENFNNCGAVLRNKRYIQDVTATTPTSFEEAYL